MLWRNEFTPAIHPVTPRAPPTESHTRKQHIISSNRYIKYLNICSCSNQNQPVRRFFLIILLNYLLVPLRDPLLSFWHCFKEKSWLLVFGACWMYTEADTCCSSCCRRYIRALWLHRSPMALSPGLWKHLSRRLPFSSVVRASGEGAAC